MLLDSHCLTSIYAYKQQAANVFHGNEILLLQVLFPIIAWWSFNGAEYTSIVWYYAFMAIASFINGALRTDSELQDLPKGHWSVPYSSAWILYIRYTNRENATLHAAHLKHGSLIRIGPREVSTNAVDGGIKVAYGGGLDKGDWYSVFNNYGSADLPRHRLFGKLICI